MAFKLFKNSKKPKHKGKNTPPIAQEQSVVVEHVPAVPGNSVLKNFYVSEKAARLINQNQYTFTVTVKANKQEIKKQVEARYSVKVTDVKVLNMPSKARNVGRHAGFKSAFRKAIVTLAEGNSINQAKS